MDKCREAFEAKYRELHPNDKCTLMANGNYSGWIKQDHWWAWQSRQAEVDEANAKSQMCRDEKTHAINRWSQIRKEVEEKDKRIETLITTWRNQAKELCNVDDKHVREALLSCADELKALRGEHE